MRKTRNVGTDLSEAERAALHRLVDDTLTRDADGITARCTCGWESRGHFSSMAASALFREHQEGKL
jgi:hypothetical protein